METLTGKSYTVFVPQVYLSELIPAKKKLRISWQNIMLRALKLYIEDLKCQREQPKI